MQTPPRRIAILAGGGSLPREIADCAARRGAKVSIVELEGEADADFGPHAVTRVDWGQIGAMLGALEKAQAQDLVFAGRVRRPDLLRIRPDSGFFRALLHVLRIMRSGGDDGVLRAVIRFFEMNGLRVIGVADAAPELVIGEGLLAGDSERAGACRSDIRLGFEVVGRLGPFDVGQAVVVNDGVVEAVEAAEGTDQMLARVIEQRRASGGASGGVLAKRTKPGQERRIDLPAIGPETVRRAAAAGLAGIAVEAGGVVALERARLIEVCRDTNVFVAGIAGPERGEQSVSFDPTERRDWRFEALGRRALSKGAGRDAERGLDVLATLDRFGAGRGVVVARGHVLAIDGGEGPAAMLRRASGLAEWGTGRWQRTGIVCLEDSRATSSLSPLMEAAKGAGLEGIVFALSGDGPKDLGRAVAAARRQKLSVARAYRKSVIATSGPSDAAGAAPRAQEGERHIFLVAGEHSGDALGERLMMAISERLEGNVRFTGVGGPGMERQGLKSLFPLSDVAVMGLSAILRRLPVLVSRVKEAADAAVAADPDAVVIIDSPELTHPIAKRIRKRRPAIPIIDYVSPSVWAWRPGRARKMRAYVDHVLALLPFEPAAHARLGGPPCTYIGHPLVERIGEMSALDPLPLAAKLGLDPARAVLVVLPGSRRSEVKRLLAPFGDALRELNSRGLSPEVIIPVVSHVRALVEAGVAAWPVVPHLVEGESDKLMAFRLAKAALAASGTVTLELAVCGTTAVVAYRVDRVMHQILKRVLPGNIASVVLANLVAGESVYPELLQDDCTGEKLADALVPLFSDTAVRARQLAALERIPQRLAIPHCTPSSLAADIVLALAERRFATETPSQ